MVRLVRPGYRKEEYYAVLEGLLKASWVDLVELNPKISTFRLPTPSGNPTYRCPYRDAVLLFQLLGLDCDSGSVQCSGLLRSCMDISIWTLD